MRFLGSVPVLLLSSFCVLSAGPLSFHGTTDKETALYQPGEKMIFSVQLLDDAKPVAGTKLKWTRTGGRREAPARREEPPVRFDGGAGVEADTLRGVPEPADFDAFWAAQKFVLTGD